MNTNLNDPNLTAFALGELSGPDQEAMAKVVAASAEAQARVREIQSLARLVRGEFRLDLQQAAGKRRSILALLEQGNFWSDRRGVLLATAALLAGCAVVATVALLGRGTSVLMAEKKNKAGREDTSLVMEAETTAPEVFASNADPSSWVPPGFDPPPTDQRSSESAFASAALNPRSTFPVQVDTASYPKVGRSIRSGLRPPKSAVQIEQMINYFSYDYPQPEGDRPFSVNLEAAACPWQRGHELVRIGLRGREIPNENRGPSNLVFLLDVSGSMNTPNGLPLVKSAIRLLVDRLTETDRVAIVVYAGASGVALPSTRGDRKEEIVRALEELKAGDLTGGIEGIELAYQIAAENFAEGGVNRVIIATDGELNVGVASERELEQMARKKARAGLALPVLRVGDDSAKSAAMQRVTEKAGGNYAHLESLPKARQVLLKQINGTLVTIAKDVQVEVVFNPARVSSYRLMGYENAIMRQANSSAPEVEMGSGHTVTALYQVVPADAGPESGQLLTVHLRHKPPDSSASILTEHSLDGSLVEWSEASADFRFAAAVAQFGMILRQSPHRGSSTLASVLETARDSTGSDASGYRTGFVELVREAQALAF